MNTPNNKRKQSSQKKLQDAFVSLLQTQELSKITVTELCKLAGVNRTTFYANYLDIFDLADAVQKRLEDEILHLYQGEGTSSYNGHDFYKLFCHIKENQIFYKTYFKLGLDGKFSLTEQDINLAMSRYDDRFIEYRIEFFRNGLNAIIKKWLQNDCRETPEEINAIIISEYNAINRRVL